MTDPLIISALSLKGGCGKSSLLMNLGGLMAEHGYKPVLIDLDAQQSATRWAQQGAEKFPFPVHPITLEKGAGAAKQAIDKLMTQHGANVILLDCPPAIDKSSLAAALISDLALVPIQHSPLDLWAAHKALETIREARAERKNKGPKAILIPSRVISRTSLARDFADALADMGEPIGPAIVQRVAVIESAIAGTTINNYSRNKASHKEFKSLLKFIENTMGINNDKTKHKRRK